MLQVSEFLAQFRPKPAQEESRGAGGGGLLEGKTEDAMAGSEGEEGGGGGVSSKLKDLYEDEKRRIAEKGIAGTIAEHKT